MLLHNEEHICNSDAFKYLASGMNDKAAMFICLLLKQSEVAWQLFDQFARERLAEEDPTPNQYAAAMRLAKSVAQLNPKAGEIGAGRLAQLVNDANAILSKEPK